MKKHSQNLLNLLFFLFEGVPEAQFLTDSEELQVAPTNPFLQSQQKQPSICITLQLLEAVTARRNPSKFKGIYF